MKAEEPKVYTVAKLQRFLLRELPCDASQRFKNLLDFSLKGSACIASFQSLALAPLIAGGAASLKCESRKKQESRFRLIGNVDRLRGRKQKKDLHLPVRLSIGEVFQKKCG